MAARPAGGQGSQEAAMEGAKGDTMEEAKGSKELSWRRSREPKSYHGSTPWIPIYKVPKIAAPLTGGQGSQGATMAARHGGGHGSQGAVLEEAKGAKELP